MTLLFLVPVGSLWAKYDRLIFFLSFSQNQPRQIPFRPYVYLQAVDSPTQDHVQSQSQSQWLIVTVFLVSVNQLSIALRAQLLLRLKLTMSKVHIQRVRVLANIACENTPHYFSIFMVQNITSTSLLYIHSESSYQIFVQVMTSSKKFVKHFSFLLFLLQLRCA